MNGGLQNCLVLHKQRTKKTCVHRRGAQDSCWSEDKRRSQEGPGAVVHRLIQKCYRDVKEMDNILAKYKLMNLTEAN